MVITAVKGDSNMKDKMSSSATIQIYRDCQFPKTEVPKSDEHNCTYFFKCNEKIMCHHYAQIIFNNALLKR